MGNGYYAEFRQDGWPLCPNCGEDELYSQIMLAWTGTGERPTMQECVDGEMTCYKCNWNSWRLEHSATIARLENPNSKHLPRISTLLAIAAVFDVALMIRFVPWGKFLILMGERVIWVESEEEIRRMQEWAGEEVMPNDVQ